GIDITFAHEASFFGWRSGIAVCRATTAHNWDHAFGDTQVFQTVNSRKRDGCCRESSWNRRVIQANAGHAWVRRNGFTCPEGWQISQWPKLCRVRVPARSCDLSIRQIAEPIARPSTRTVVAPA